VPLHGKRLSKLEQESIDNHGDVFFRPLLDVAGINLVNINDIGCQLTNSGTAATSRHNCRNGQGASSEVQWVHCLFPTYLKLPYLYSMECMYICMYLAVDVFGRVSLVGLPVM
jgi:hypothetical protein